MSAEFERIEHRGVAGFLHRPVNSAAPGLVLTHGAGATCASPLLIAVANALCSAGFLVLRYDLPFRQRRRFGPPHPSAAAEDRAGVGAAVELMRAHASGVVIAGGHSYGGRQSTMLASEDAALCDALLLLSYPLHPPNKPAQMRTEHFANLHTPALFVHGTNDPFGSMEELKLAIALIPSRTELVQVAAAGHDLNRGRFDIPNLIVEPLRALYSG
jgi:uncharacterized protein